MIEFADRLWLLLLPVSVVLLILLFWIDRRGRRASIRRFASGRLVSDLLESYSPTRKRLKNALLVVSAALLFLSLARPQWGHTWTESRSRGIDLVFALDSSRSMLANDIKPNRLIRAKLAIEDLVNRLEGDRIGLVAFSGSAFLQCPLTLDYDAFFQSLDAIDTNVISAGGTDLAAALQESEAAFSSDNNFKILVLITDGEDLEGSGVAQARKAAENGVTVYTVGVGTPEGAPIPVRTRTGATQYVRDENGRVVQSKLDPDTLQTIAEETGGFYVNLGPTGYGLEQVLEAGIGSIPEEEISSELQRTAIERFQWPLALALLLLILEPLIGTRRGQWRIRSRRTATTSAVLLILAALPFGSPPHLSAFPSSGPFRLPPVLAAQLPQDETDDPATDGQATVRNPEADGASPPPPESAFARAVREKPGDPIARFNRGTELYEEGHYGRAAESFTEALRYSEDFSLQADSFYNLGNTRFREGAEGFQEEAPSQVTRNAEGVTRENRPAIQTGEELLRASKAGRNPQPQQIQSAIGFLEQREKATTEGLETLEAALTSENVAKSLWQRSVNDFESALELAPDHEDARHNLDFVKEQTAALTTQITQQEKLQSTQEEQRTRIRELIEELKKLLEQQQNQEQQDQDQQQQQQQDQQQDQENQQNQDQNQQQGSSEGSQQEQQGDQDPSQSQQESNRQDEEDTAGEEQQQPEQDQQPSDRESQPSEADDSPGSEEEGESREERSPEDRNGEQPESGNEETPADEADPQSGGEEEPEASGERGDEEGREEEQPAGGSGEQAREDESETIQLGDEQARELAEEREAAAETEAAAEGAPTGEEGEEIVLGVMSPEDAARLLDSLKNNERKLPFAGSGSEGAANRRNQKDW